MNEFKAHKRYFYLFFSLLSCIFIIYIIRFFYLQVIKIYFFTQQAQSFIEREEIIPAQRGYIFDRNGYLLASNQETFDLSIDLKKIPQNERENIFFHIETQLKLEMGFIQEYIDRFKIKSKQSFILRRNLSFHDLAQLLDRQAILKGIDFFSSYQRRYHYSGVTSLSHILGYIGSIDNDEYIRLYHKGYRLDDLIGKSGVEQSYDKVLRGKEGRKKTIVDVYNNPVKKPIIIKYPQKGSDIFLSIDWEIQKKAQRALGKRKGSLIVLKPYSGEILAMVNYPNYNANYFYTLKRNTYFSQLIRDPDKPFLNRSIQSVYPPGSIFKAIVITALLNEKFDPEERVFSSGYLMVGNRRFNDHSLAQKKSSFNMKEGFALSSDVYFYTKGLELGVDRLYKYAQLFFLDRKQNIDIYGEKVGLVPNSLWKKKLYDEWNLGDTANFSIGQGYLLTSPLAMSTALSLIVNEGIAYQPYFVNKIISSEKKIITPVSSKILLSLKKEISDDVWKEVKNLMFYAAKEGSFSPVMIGDIPIAGKTGTAQVKSGDLTDILHSWFISFAPYGASAKDQIAVVVLVEGEKGKWEFRAPKAANLLIYSILKNISFEQTLEELNPWYKSIFIDNE